MKHLLVSFVLVLPLLIPGWTFSQFVASQYLENIPPPEYYGKVILDNFSRKSGVDPVVFDHWLHRAKFTCRLCHIDVGFAMEAGATMVTAADNMSGYYCGACHNGKRTIGDKVVFGSCAVGDTEEERKRCGRCHSKTETGQGEYDYEKVTAGFPLLKRNLIDWEKAELLGKVNPLDFLESISHERPSLKAQRDFSIEAAALKSNVIFSHKKHTVWNGCEVCHPLIFRSSKKGTVQYSMFEIMEGEYCGMCHLTVAFPVWLCAKCHRDSVQ
jgi:c(7)-type cytochrome triheme protein